MGGPNGAGPTRTCSDHLRSPESCEDEFGEQGWIIRCLCNHNEFGEESSCLMQSLSEDE